MGIVLLLVGVLGSAVAAAPPAVAVEISGIADCPSAAGVRAELTRLGTQPPASGEPGVADHAEVMGDARGVRVRLRRADGQIFAERSIATAPACGERAAAVAVVIATWEAELRSDVTLELRALPREPPPAPPWWLSVGAAGLGVADAARSWAAGAGLDFQVAHDRGWGLRATGWGAGFRSEPFADGPGRARWTRLALGVGPAYELRTRAAVLSLFAQLAVAQIRVGGEGFTTTHRDATFDWGARGGFDAALGRGALVPVVGLGGVVWPRRQDAVAVGVAGRATLPTVDLMVTVGLRWSPRRGR